MTQIHISKLKDIDIVSKLSYESICFFVDPETKLTEGNLVVTTLEDCLLPVLVDELSDLRAYLNIKVSRYSYKLGKWWSVDDDQFVRPIKPESAMDVIHVTKGQRHTIKIKLQENVRAPDVHNGPDSGPDGRIFHWKISASNHSKMLQDTITCEYESESECIRVRGA